MSALRTVRVVWCALLWLVLSYVPSAAQELRYQRIFFPQRDEVKLVPEGYSQRELEEIDLLLRGNSQQTVLESPQLQQTEYFVWFDAESNTLRSDHSTLSIQYQDDLPGQLDLGVTTLALAMPEVDADNLSPAVYCGADGRLFALVDQTCDVPLAWSQAGQPQTDRSVQFNLQLPAAIQSTMWLHLPASYGLKVSSGVAEKVGTLPEDQAVAATSANDRLQDAPWWRINLATVDQIRLTVFPETTEVTEMPAVLRRASIDYSVQPFGLTWTASFKVDYGGEQQLPTFGLRGEGRVTAVSVNAQAVRWTETRQQEELLIRLENSNPILTAEARVADVVITGVAGSEVLARSHLPWLRPIRSRIVTADPNLFLQIRASEAVQLEPSSLQDRWLLLDSGADGKSYQLLGGHTQAPPSLRLRPSTHPIRGAAMTGIHVEPNVLEARWSCLLQRDSDQPRRLRLRLAEGWELKSLVGPDGTLNSTRDDGGWISVWLESREPGPERPTELQVMASRTFAARRPLRVDGGWVVHLDEASLEEFAYLQVPGDRVAQPVLAGQRRAEPAADASEAFLTLLKRAPANALRFMGPGGIPATELRDRAARFDADLSTTIDDVNEMGLRWQSRITLKPQGYELSEVRVRLQPADTSEIRWVLEDPTQSTVNVLSAERTSSAEATEWLLKLDAPRSASFAILGTMSLPGDRASVPLPIVQGAINQRAEVILNAGVARLPSTDGSDGIVLLPGDPLAKESTRLSYPVDREAKLDIQRMRSGPLPELVCWSWRATHHLGFDGERQVVVEAVVHGAGNLRLDLPAQVVDVDLFLNDQPLKAGAFTWRDQNLSLPVRAATRQDLRLILHCQGLVSGFAWWFQPSRLLPACPILQQETKIVAAADLWLLPAITQDELPRILALHSSTAMLLIAALLLVTLGCGWSATHAISRWLVTVVATTLALVALLLPMPLRHICVLLAFSLALTNALRMVHLHFEARQRRDRSGLMVKSVQGSSRAASAYISLLVLLAVLSLAAVSEAETPPSATAPQILIPVDEDGKFVGPNVWVPNTLYRQLVTRSSQARQDALFFRSASYSLNLIRTTDLSETSSPRLEARWQVYIPDASQEYPLILPADALQRLELIESGMPTTLRWRRGEDRIYFQPTRPGLLALRATLITNLQTAGDLVTLSAPLPRVANANFTMRYDANTNKPVVLNSQGPVVYDSSSRGLTAQLGPVDNLSVRWRLPTPATVPNEPRGTPRWWVQVGGSGTSVELEFDRVSVAGTVQMTVDRSDLPLLTNPRWQLVRTGLLEGERRSLELRAIGETPGPIRLLWYFPAINATETFAVPTFRVDDARPTATVLLGVYAPRGFAIEPRNPTAERLPLEILLDAWQGHKGEVSNCYRLEANAAPLLSIQRPAFTVPQCDELTRLHVTNVREHRLRYELQVRSATSFTAGLRLALPEGMIVDRLELDRSVTPIVPIMDQNQPTLFLHPSQVTNLKNLVLEGRLLIATNRFSAPRIAISGCQINTSIYDVVRDPGLRVSALNRNILEPLSLEIPATQKLNDLVMPVWRWNISQLPTNITQLPETLRVESRSLTCAANLTTTVRWSEGNWTSETVVQAERLNGLSDFLSLELPEVWSDSVSVEPPLPYSLLPSDNGVRVINLLPSTAENVDQVQFTIRSRYAADAGGTADIPIVRLRGGGSRKLRYVVPGRLTSQPLRWNTVAMRRVPLEAEDLPVDPLPPDPLVFEPDTLAGRFGASPVAEDRQGNEAARASLCETWLFVAPHRPRYLLVRWDLYPGSRRTLQAELPPQAKVTRVTSCDRAAVTSVDARGRLQVELGLSQLAQPLEVLLELPSQGPLHLPRLDRVQVDKTLLHLLTPTEFTPLESEFTPAWTEVAEVAPWRRAAAADVLAESLDALADRPRNEVTAWLTSWIPRLVPTVGTVPSAAVEPTATAPPSALDPQRIEDLPPQIQNLIEKAGQPPAAMPLAPVSDLPAFTEVHWSERRLMGTNALPTSPLIAAIPAQQDMTLSWWFGILGAGLGMLALVIYLYRHFHGESHHVPASIPLVLTGLVALPVLPLVSAGSAFTAVAILWIQHRYRITTPS